MPVDGVHDRGGRQRLLEAAAGELIRHGLHGRSLRGLAADLQTSHRMLLYYFGSKAGLVEAAIATVGSRQQTLLVGLLDRDGSPEECLQHLFALALDPVHGPGLLFLDPAVGAGAGAGGPPPALTRAWLEAFTRTYQRAGYPPAAAAASARAALAAARGMLLDLNVTGDRPAVEAATAVFLRVTGR